MAMRGREMSDTGNSAGGGAETPRSRSAEGGAFEATASEGEGRPEMVPDLGIIMLDTTFPRIPGDVGNPATFPFPVHYEVVEGASPRRVVREADPALLSPFIEAARKLERMGVRAIGTSCGFLAIFQRELAGAVTVPVLSSSLLQVAPAARNMAEGRRVGILTACGRSLTDRHLAGVGVERSAVAIMGMEDAPEFTAVFLEGKGEIDVARCRREVVAAARRMADGNPDLGAVVLECTNMPPYAAAVQEALGLPVYDVVTLLSHARSVAVREPFG